MTYETDMRVAADVPTSSAVNWGAIIAGAVVATAATLILVLVGSGFGLTIISPWPSQSSSAATVVASTAIWLVVTQWISSCLGGYIAGRLRRRWTGVHSDEVVFRDSAHGLLVWSLATLLIAGLLGSTLSAIVNSAVKTASNVAASATEGAASATNSSATTAYFIDALFRPTDPSRLAEPGAQEAVGQATRIFAMSIANGQVAESDKNYLASWLRTARDSLRPMRKSASTRSGQWFRTQRQKPSRRLIRRGSRRPRRRSLEPCLS